MSTARFVMPTLAPLHNAHTAHPPAFELTFNSEGRIYKALVRARNVHAASHEGLLELATQCPDFNPEKARLLAAIQTR